MASGPIARLRVPAGRVLEAGPLGEGVDQVGLAPGQVPHPLEGFLLELLPGLLGVLAQQRPHLRLREVPQPQRLRLDVEGAATLHVGALAGRVDAVVAHVSDPAQHHALRKLSRPPLVLGSQLPQHRDQGVPHQAVDFVDQQHERLRTRQRPLHQHFAQGAMRPVFLQDSPLGRVREAVPENPSRSGADLAENGLHALGHVPARCLGNLDVDVQAAIAALGVEQVLQCDQHGGLARLPRRMQHEVLLPADQREELLEIDALQRLHAVVVPPLDRTLGVEEPQCGFSIAPGSHGPAFCAARSRAGARGRVARFGGRSFARLRGSRRPCRFADSGVPRGARQGTRSGLRPLIQGRSDPRPGPLKHEHCPSRRSRLTLPRP